MNGVSWEVNGVGWGVNGVSWEVNGVSWGSEWNGLCVLLRSLLVCSFSCLLAVCSMCSCAQCARVLVADAHAISPPTVYFCVVGAHQRQQEREKASHRLGRADVWFNLAVEFAEQSERSPCLE